MTGPSPTFVVVNSSGGVVQSTVTGGEVVAVTIDWDEIFESNETAALTYAQSLLIQFDGLPEPVREEYRAKVFAALDEQGYTFSDDDDDDDDDDLPDHRYNSAPMCGKCGGPCEMDPND